MPRRRLLLHHHQTAYEPETLELPEEVVIPKKNAPSVNGTLRQTALRVPEVTWQCSGIMVFGKKIRSLVFSTDLAIIKNINADAVIAVYPFTPQPIINEALLMASDIPVFTGVGGGLTKGHRVVNLAMYAEMQGAMGVVVNVPTSGLVISRMRRAIDIPIVVTVANHGTDYARRIDDGAAIFNVAAGSATAEIVAEIRAQYPDMPIMATGGPSDREHPAHDRRRGQRHHLYPALFGGAVQAHDGTLQDGPSLRIRFVDGSFAHGFNGWFAAKSTDLDKQSGGFFPFGRL